MDHRDHGHIGGAARLGRVVASRDVLLEGRGANRVEAVGLVGPRGVPARRTIAMIALLAALPTLAMAVQALPSVNELVALARDAPDSVLVERVRHRSYDVPGALRQLLAAAGGREDSVRVTPLPAAERLASAWLVAWRDSFYVRKVSRFRSLAPPDRRANVTADSLLSAGNDAMRSAGLDAAMRA